jgi:hypothetical protein
MAKPNKSTAASPLEFDEQTCTMDKYSNNLLKFGKEYVTAWTLPIEGLSLEREQINRLLGPKTFESWFNQTKDGAWTPMDWWQHVPGGELKLEDEFDIETLKITVSGNRVAKFEAEEVEDPDDKKKKRKRPGARITSIYVKAVHGGIVLLSCHLHVLPGIGTPENERIQEHQKRPVKITFSNATLSEADPKQKDLPLTPGTGKPAETNGSALSDQDAANAHAKAFDAAPPGPNEGKSGDVKDFEKGAREKVAAHKAKTGSRPRPRGH